MHLLNTLPQRLDPGATPTFAGLIAPSLTSPASTNLTLGTGTSGAAITVLSASNNVGIGTTTPTVKLDVVPAVAKTDTTSFGYGVFSLRTNEATNFSSLGIAFIGGASQASRGFQFQTGEAFVSNVGKILFQPYGGDVLIGTTDATGLTGVGGLKIGSTTAGSSGAGALVVQGGISAGNTGAASYFGGAVTVASASPSLALSGSDSKLLFTDTGVGATSRNWAIAASQAAEGDFSIFVSSAVGGDPIFGTKALGFDRTGAATFAGAVAIGNTTAVSVAAPSTHKVSILIGGVQYYLLASNV